MTAYYAQTDPVYIAIASGLLGELHGEALEALEFTLDVGNYFLLRFA